MHDGPTHTAINASFRQQQYQCRYSRCNRRHSSVCVAELRCIPDFPGSSSMLLRQRWITSFKRAKPKLFYWLSAPHFTICRTAQTVTNTASVNDTQKKHRHSLWRNNEARSCNHCCSGKSNRYHIVSVCVCSLRFLPWHVPYCHLWPVR